MFSLYFEANPDLNRLNLPELQGLRLSNAGAVNRRVET
jgi:hypothetical protein